MAAGSLGSQLPSYMKLAKGLDTSWHEDALCRRSALGHEAWLTAQSDIRRGSKSEATLLERRARAKMMCQVCPVQWDCTIFAAKTKDIWSISGIDEMERGALLKFRPKDYERQVREWETDRISVADGVRILAGELADVVRQRGTV